MKKYISPASVGRYSYSNGSFAVIPLIAGAVGAVAGKALAAAVVGAAAAGGAKVAHSLMGRNDYRTYSSPNLQVVKLK